jgi:hypothetical protein
MSRKSGQIKTATNTFKYSLENGFILVLGCEDQTAMRVNNVVQLQHQTAPTCTAFKPLTPPFFIGFPNVTTQQPS